MCVHALRTSTATHVLRSSLWKIATIIQNFGKIIYFIYYCCLYVTDCKREPLGGRGSIAEEAEGGDDAATDATEEDLSYKI